jgi:alanyl-tRNA synthetase
MLTANEIRQQFLDFFVQKHGHTAVPSSSVVPLDDPTLLFTNAGMNQFKDVFLGTGTRPYKRAVDSQKCIRAGGKHNDLEDVGRDTYHHTFFEMLGNWSFGDYFKKEAIAWAWELLTKVWKLDKSRLHATVFEGDAEQGLARDDEAAEFWRTQTDIDPSHIHLGNKKDNFWMMGDTGPCGPCTEIHIDRTPDKSGGRLVNKGDARVIEIWNLVFIQFNQDKKGRLQPLPAKHVDTGMGFERVTAVLQGKASNYDTDVFTPIMDAIGELVGKQYGGNLESFDDVAFRVIADHIRALTFALNDGAVPSNVGRGYVVRSILRRAERYGWQQFGIREPFLHRLVATVVAQMGGAFPELKRNPAKVSETILEEEQSFLRTLERGMRLFQTVAQVAIVSVLKDKPDHDIWRETEDQSRLATTSLTTSKIIFLKGAEEVGVVTLPSALPELRRFYSTRCLQPPVIAGQSAFDLHTTHGLFIDIVEQMAAEAGMTVDRAGYEEAMRRHQIISGQGREKLVIAAVSGDLPPTDDSLKYGPPTTTGKLVGWVKDNLVGHAGQFNCGDQVALLLDRTNFYAEQGGQVGDQGIIKTSTGTFEVEDTQRLGESVLHLGRVQEGGIKIGQKATLEVSGVRADTMRNHTATHLLNWALRKVLGDHIEQKGSLVDPDKTRFDFAHTGPLTPEEVAEVERLVNEKLYLDLPVKAVTMPLTEAKRIPGVRAVFGEKYPDPVRVLLIGAERPEEVTADQSVEFCGGTHLAHTGQAGFFKILGQEAVGKGVRRVTAVTGREAVATVQRLSSVLDELTGRFRCQPEDLASRIDGLQEEIKKLQQQLKKGAAGDLQSVADKLLESAPEINGARVVVGEMPAAPEEQMRQQLDRLRQKAGSVVIVLGWTEDSKVQLMAAVTDDLVKKGVKAGQLVGEAAKVVGGKGGGRPTMAQAGGKEPAKLGEALQLARKLALEQLSQG